MARSRHDDIIVTEKPRQQKPVTVGTVRPWTWLGWFGFLLSIVGLSDLGLSLYPPQFGSPEWEFATIASTLSGLPLVSMGLAGLLASGLGLGSRSLVLAMAMAFLIGAISVAALSLIFLLDVPLALRATQGVASLGIKKAIVKTGVLGIGFSIAYALTSLLAFRAARLGR